MLAAKNWFSGATELGVVDEPPGRCLVMADPEGNEFCLQ